MARPSKDAALNIPERAVTEAISLLRETGSDFSMAALAKRVGCSAPALYAHFANKDDLLRHVRTRAFEMSLREKAARYLTPADDPVARLRDRGLALVAFGQQNPALYRLLYAARPDVAAEGPDVSDRSLQALTAGVEAAQGAGFAPGLAPQRVALTLWFAVHGAIMMALDAQLPGPETQRWQRAREAVETLMALFSQPAPLKEEAP